MSKKLIVLAGISGSGKSSYAAELVQEHPHKYALVNRDKIRELLFGYTEETIVNYHKRPDLGKLEKQVTLYEDTLIHEGLNLDKTVIVDATHLKKEYLERFKFWNVPIRYVYFDTPIKVAIERDSTRNRRVGEEVIKRQFEAYSKLERIKDYEPITFENDESKPTCFLIDLDGTLAHMSGRSAFEWIRVGEDSIDKSVKTIVNSIGYHSKVFICTGRDGVCLKETTDWLIENRVSYDHIFIRREKDQRPDWVVKEEIWREISKDFYIAGLVDDRNQVVRRARALGLKVFQVDYGNF